MGLTAKTAGAAGGAWASTFVASFISVVIAFIVFLAAGWKVALVAFIIAFIVTLVTMVVIMLGGTWLGRRAGARLVAAGSAKPMIDGTVTGEASQAYQRRRPPIR